MQDVERIYPYVMRRNYKHRARVTKALRELGVIDHLFPNDFFRRHWRDQQAYIEQILGLKFCARCKVPVPYLDGAICAPCADTNRTNWTSVRALRERAIERSLADKPNVPLDIMDTFRERNADSKVVRIAREYGISMDDAQQIYDEHHSPKESSVSPTDILNKAAKRS